MRPIVARLSCTIAAILVTFMLHAVANAEQQITLKAGANQVVKISRDGSQFTIDVDGSKLHFSFTDTAEAILATNKSLRQTEHLLLKGLETNLLHGGGQKEIGFFSEAHQLSPDDARVSYWYARSLVNAGMGKAARKVFNSQRDAIDAAYPGLANQLADQIEQRIQVESLPIKLIRQIDAINTAVSGVPVFISDNEPCAAYFRLVDQHNEPIKSSAFHIACNGQNERLQSFDDGYHLFTYVRRRRSNHSPCRLGITHAELQSKTFEFDGEVNGIADAGVFQVNRMGDEDRRLVVVQVVDAQGEPMAGVSVMLAPTRRRRGGDRIPTVKTDSLGRVEMRLFPNKYNCNVSRTGYNRAFQSIELTLDRQEPITAKLKLHRLILATVKIEWRAESLGSPNHPGAPAETTSTGEIELRHGGHASNSRMHDSAMPWVRILQKEGQLQLHFQGHAHYGREITTETWIGRADTQEGPVVNFEAIDLANLDEWKKTKSAARNQGAQSGQNTSFNVKAEKGALYVGKIIARGRHHRNLRLVGFKVLVTEQGDAR